MLNGITQVDAEQSHTAKEKVLIRKVYYSALLTSTSTSLHFWIFAAFRLLSAFQQAIKCLTPCSIACKAMVMVLFCFPCSARVSNALTSSWWIKCAPLLNTVHQKTASQYLVGFRKRFEVSAMAYRSVGIWNMKENRAVSPALYYMQKGGINITGRWDLERRWQAFVCVEKNRDMNKDLQCLSLPPLTTPRTFEEKNQSIPKQWAVNSTHCAAVPAILSSSLPSAL